MNFFEKHCERFSPCNLRGINKNRFVKFVCKNIMNTMLYILFKTLICIDYTNFMVHTVFLCIFLRGPDLKHTDSRLCLNCRWFYICVYLLLKTTAILSLLMIQKFYFSFYKLYLIIKVYQEFARHWPWPSLIS